MNDNSKNAKALRYSGAIGGKQQYKWQSKVDKAFETLEAQGIVARHDFSDCMTGGAAEIEDEIRRFARSGNPVGYTFYHGQDTFHADDCGVLHLAYGSVDKGY